MNSIHVAPAFRAFLEKEDLACPVCFEAYDLTDRAHTPAMIGNCIHTLCMECFSQLQMNACPKCHSPLRDRNVIHKHPLVLDLVESAKKRWVLESQIAGIDPQPIPNNFASSVKGCLTESLLLTFFPVPMVIWRVVLLKPI